MVVVAVAVADPAVVVVAVAAVVLGWGSWVCMGERECTVLAPGGWVYCRKFVRSSMTALCVWFLGVGQVAVFFGVNRKEKRVSVRKRRWWRF